MKKDRFRGLDLSIPANIVEFISRKHTQKLDIAEFKIELNNQLLSITDLQSKVNYQYNWIKSDYMTLSSDSSTPICSVNLKDWCSQYSIKNANGFVGALNHQRVQFRHSFYGKLITLDNKRVEIYVCKHDLSHPFSQISKLD